MLGPSADLLQIYDVINISDNVKILPKCDNTILLKARLLTLVNEGLATISNISTVQHISVLLIPAYLKSTDK